MLPHTWWQLLPYAHTMGWLQTHSSVPWWNGALSAQFVQKEENLPWTRQIDPNTSQPHAVHSYRESITLPDSKGIGNKHRQYFLFIQATNTESCGDWPSFLLTLTVFLVAPCWFMFSLKTEGSVFWSLLENEWRCDALQKMPRHFSPMFSLCKSHV